MIDISKCIENYVLEFNMWLFWKPHVASDKLQNFQRAN